MTPDEHAARAKELADDADELYETINETLDLDPVSTNDWEILRARIDLARLHADLARLPELPRRGHVPTNEVVDYPGDDEL